MQILALRGQEETHTYSDSSGGRVCVFQLPKQFFLLVSVFHTKLYVLPDTEKTGKRDGQLLDSFTDIASILWNIKQQTLM